MNKNRLEAFSDGVLAIIMTIMVLDLKIPHAATLEALWQLGPVFVSFLLSFVFIGIYWGNHHHLLHTLNHVNSKIIWANMFLLFTLSLIPFTTGWMGENNFSRIPVAAYAVNLLLSAIAFFILQNSIIHRLAHKEKLMASLKRQEKKGIRSIILYSLSILTAFFYPLISAVLIITVAIMWIIPDKHIESALEETSQTDK